MQVQTRWLVSWLTVALLGFQDYNFAKSDSERKNSSSDDSTAKIGVLKRDSSQCYLLTLEDKSQFQITEENKKEIQHLPKKFRLCLESPTLNPKSKEIIRVTMYAENDDNLILADAEKDQGQNLGRSPASYLVKQSPLIRRYYVFTSNNTLASPAHKDRTMISFNESKKTVDLGFFAKNKISFAFESL